MISFLKQVRAEGLLYVTNHIVARIPSQRLRLLFYRRVMRYEIGADSYIFMGAWFFSRRGFRMGDHCVINQNCRLDTRGGIKIGSNVSIAADTHILTADHDPRCSLGSGRSGPVRIEDYVMIGTRAMILRGVTVGRGAMVAAGAIVTKDVEPFTVVAGSPARAIGTRNPDLKYEIIYGRLFA